MFEFNYNKELDVKQTQYYQGPLYVVLNITNRCNLKCLHCFNGSSSTNQCSEYELSDEEVINVVKDVARLKVANFCFSGGEPLLRKELIYKSIKILSSHGVRCSIVSNGTLIDYNVAEKLKLLGVQEIEISLDGNCSETHERLRGVKGSFEKALKSVEYLCAIGITTSISYTLNSWNVDEVGPLIERLKDSGITSFYIRPLLVMGEASFHKENISPSLQQYRKVFKIMKKYQEQNYNFEIGITDPINHIYNLRNRVINNMVEIQSNGDLFPSYCIPVPIGNIKRHPLKDYWDKGLNRIWEFTSIGRLAEGIYSNKDLEKIISNIKTEVKMDFDIIDDNILFEGTW